MKKTKKRGLRALGLILSLLLLLAACGEIKETSKSNSTSSETTTQAPPADEEIYEIIKDGKTAYSLVFAEEATEAEASEASKIAAVFRETGVKFETKKDDGYIADAKEIAVGISVNYPETKSVRETLGYKDYAILKVGEKIVVTAGSEAAFADCVSYLVKKIISGTGTDGKKELSVTPRIFTAKYAQSEMKIAGNEISKYRIVYPKAADISYFWAAEKWQAQIGELSGIRLEITDDSAAVSEFEILVGKTNRSQSAQVYTNTPKLMNFTLSVKDGKLISAGAGVYSVGLSAEAFAKEVQQIGKNAEVDEDFSLSGDLMTDAKIPFSSGNDIRVMSANILAELPSYAGNATGFDLSYRAEIFAANVRFSGADIVGIQEATSLWISVLPAYLGPDYSIVSEKLDNGKQNYSCIIYNNKTLELIEKGVTPYTVSDNKECRNMGFGVFRVKSTGKTFAFISTHWNLGKNSSTAQADDLIAKMTELSAGGTRSVISLGDFNTGLTGIYYNHLMGNSTLQNLKLTTENLVNDFGTSRTGLGTKTSDNAPTIDFIFATSDVKCGMFMTLVGNHSSHMSDHNALIADVKLK